MSDVYIRDVQDGDIPVFFEHQRDPVATKMARFPSRQRDAFVAHWAKIRADRTCFVQTIVAQDQIAGNLVSWDEEGKREVGYWLGREHWGHGIATEALALFLGRMTIRPVYAYAAPHNAGSIRVLEKCGFQPALDVDSENTAEGEGEGETGDEGDWVILVIPEG